MNVLLYLPEADNYSYKPDAQHARVQHRGPAGRFAGTVPSETARVPATWLLTAEEFKDFGLFYQEHGEGQVPFLVDLITRTGELRQCVAFFDTDSFSFDSNSGESYRISCTLQVAEL